VAAVEFGKSATGFFDAAMAEFLAEGECGGEALAGEFGFAKTEVGEAAEMETVGLAPGVLAVGFEGEIEGFAGSLESFLEVAGGEVGFGEGNADIDGVFAEAAGIGEEDAGFAFGDALGEIADVTGEFAGGLETAELEFNVAGSLGECAGLLQVFRRCGEIALRQNASQ
jgi:hypothetical protein